MRDPGGEPVPDPGTFMLSTGLLLFSFLAVIFGMRVSGETEAGRQLLAAAAFAVERALFMRTVGHVGILALSTFMYVVAIAFAVCGMMEDPGSSRNMVVGLGWVFLACERYLFGHVVYALDDGWRKRKKKKGTVGNPGDPWPTCPHCPPYRSGELWYGQPAESRGRDGLWAWCGRCGALYVESRGRWDRPRPEEWDQTFRNEAP